MREKLSAFRATLEDNDNASVVGIVEEAVGASLRENLLRYTLVVMRKRSLTGFREVSENHFHFFCFCVYYFVVAVLYFVVSAVNLVYFSPSIPLIVSPLPLPSSSFLIFLSSVQILFDEQRMRIIAEGAATHIEKRMFGLVTTAVDKLRQLQTDILTRFERFVRDLHDSEDGATEHEYVVVWRKRVIMEE